MYCPICWEPVKKTNWLPAPGEEPTLREYQCLNTRCKHVFYLRTGRPLKVEGQDERKDFQLDMFPVEPRID